MKKLFWFIGFGVLYSNYCFAGLTTRPLGPMEYVKRFYKLELDLCKDHYSSQKYFSHCEVPALPSAMTIGRVMGTDQADIDMNGKSYRIWVGATLQGVVASGANYGPGYTLEIGRFGGGYFETVPLEEALPVFQAFIDKSPNGEIGVTMAREKGATPPPVDPVKYPAKFREEPDSGKDFPDPKKYDFYEGKYQFTPEDIANCKSSKPDAKDCVVSFPSSPLMIAPNGLDEPSFFLMQGFGGTVSLENRPFLMGLGFDFSNSYDPWTRSSIIARIEYDEFYDPSKPLSAPEVKDFLVRHRDDLSLASKSMKIVYAVRKQPATSARYEVERIFDVPGIVRELRWMLDVESIVGTLAEKGIYIWNKNGQASEPLPQSQNLKDVTPMTMSQDGALIARGGSLGNEPKQVWVWDLRSRKLVQKLSDDAYAKNSQWRVLFSQESNTLYVFVLQNGSVLADIWDAASGQRIRRVNLSPIAQTANVLFNAALTDDEDRVSLLTYDQTNDVYRVESGDLASGKVLNEFILPGHRYDNFPGNQPELAVLTQDGKSVFTFDGENAQIAQEHVRIQHWDIASGTVTDRFYWPRIDLDTTQLTWAQGVSDKTGRFVLTTGFGANLLDFEKKEWIRLGKPVQAGALTYDGYAFGEVSPDGSRVLAGNVAGKVFVLKKAGPGR